MGKRNIIVIGASQGELDAIRTLIKGLPTGNDVSILDTDTAQALSEEQGQLMGFVKTMRDLTEQGNVQETRRQLEERYRIQLEKEVEIRTAELKESKEQYASLVENTPDVITRWDKELKLVFANSAFEGKTVDGRNSLLGKNYSEMGQPHEIFVPYMEGLRKAFETGKIVEHFNSLSTDRGEVHFYSRLTPEKNAFGEVETVLAIARDITEIKIAEREIKENQDLLQATLDSSSNMIRVFKAVRDEEGKIIDFNSVLNNATSKFLYGEHQGESLLQRNPGVMETGIFDHFVQVTETGVPQQYEKNYVHEQFSGWYFQSVVKLNDGVATSTLDITDRKLAELALKESRDLLQSILDTSFIGMSVLKAVRDEEGNIMDFEIRLTNKELNKETGRTDLIGKLYAEEFPGIRDVGIFNLMVRVMETGVAEGLEYYYPYENFNKWFSCMFVKMEDGLVATNLDITERKLAEAHLQKSEEQLRMFVTASSDLIYQMNADWTVMSVLESGNFLINSNESTGGWMTDYIPEVDQEKVQSAINEAIFTKQAFQLEHRVNLATGKIGWVYSKAVPQLDATGTILEWFGVASNITARKLSEEERNKNYLLLQQSENVAATGTWDYDLLTGTFTWSEGMYRLFDLKKGKKVSPDIYLQYATEECRDSAMRIARYISEGNAEFEDTLTINTGKVLKVIKIKATVVKNEQGETIRVLGVDMDETANRDAENRLRQLEAELQLEIFRVTLRTQEEERRRISESLHNGLGQMLFGIKISMSHLASQLAVSDPEKYERARKYTEELLRGAIKESRKISHELMPMTLEQFGLQSAIDGICRQLNDEVKFDCSYHGLERRLEKYLELAVYRTVQELMLNVLKHAKAIRAEVNVSIEEEIVKITVSDNGIGMPNGEQTPTGIGLSSIRSKIKLLNGSVKITSPKGGGTKITVEIPIDANSKV